MLTSAYVKFFRNEKVVVANDPDHPDGPAFYKEERLFSFFGK